MKIPLMVDAAYAFDYISILNIKNKENPTKENFFNLKNCEKNIDEAINNIDLVDQIYKSKEYSDLWHANKEVFDLVSLAKKNLCQASEIDEANYRRFICKQTLQKKFFLNGITETKIGY